MDRERAGQFLVLLGKFGFLGFERDIFGAEQLDVVLHVAVKNVISGGGSYESRYFSPEASERQEFGTTIVSISRSGCVT